jgi:hypothetical protein
MPLLKAFISLQPAQDIVQDKAQLNLPLFFLVTRIGIQQKQTEDQISGLTYVNETKACSINSNIAGKTAQIAVQDKQVICIMSRNNIGH